MQNETNNFLKMKYPKIQSLVPAGEFFDESAIINEGGYLSVNHLNAIEANIANKEAAYNASCNILQLELDNAKEQLQSLTTSEKKLQETIAEQKTTITALNAQVTELSKVPSGTGSSTIVTGDEPTEQEIPSYLSDSNPANAWADKHMRRKK